MVNRFNHLHVPDQWEMYWSKYPNGYTILEALIQWVQQVDKMVDNQNGLNQTVTDYRKELDEFIKQFGGELQSQVVNTLSEWQASGFLNIVIDEAIITELDEIDTRLSREIAEVAINVKSYGAVGDGITDDTQAIQSIINNAKPKSRIDFTDGTFLVTEPISLRSDIHYLGTNAILHMPPVATGTKEIFRLRDNQKEVTIEGLVFTSERTQPGTEHYLGTLVSNVLGMAVSGVTNVLIKKCKFIGMNYGVKQDSASDGSNISKGLVFEDIDIDDTWTGLYLSHVDGIDMRRITIDAIGTQPGYLHPIYINTYFKNARMEDLRLFNSSGVGIIIQNSAFATKPTDIENIEVKNIIIDGCYSHGISVIGKNVKFENIDIRNYALGTLGASNAIRVQGDLSTIRVHKGIILTNGMVSQVESQANIKLFEMVGVIIDAINDNTETEAFMPSGTFNIEGCVFMNWKPLKRLLYNNASGATTSVFEGCKVYYLLTPATFAFSIRGSNTLLLVKQNDFFNLSGTVFASLCYNTNASKGTVFRDNNLYGYTDIKSASDTATTSVNNWVDASKTVK